MFRLLGSGSTPCFSLAVGLAVCLSIDPHYYCFVPQTSLACTVTLPRLSMQNFLPDTCPTRSAHGVYPLITFVFFSEAKSLSRQGFPSRLRRQSPIEPPFSYLSVDSKFLNTGFGFGTTGLFRRGLCCACSLDSMKKMHNLSLSSQFVFPVSPNSDSFKSITAVTT